MNGSETAAAERILEHQRAVHLIDAVAIRDALLGTPVALTELERGAAVTICDLQGLDRELLAVSLGMGRHGVDKLIVRQRADADFAFRSALAEGMRAPAAGLVDAVRARDVDAVAEVLTPLSTQGLFALAVVLADLAAAPRDPGADEAPPPP